MDDEHFVFVVIVLLHPNIYIVHSIYSDLILAKANLASIYNEFIDGSIEKIYINSVKLNDSNSLIYDETDPLFTMGVV